MISNLNAQKTEDKHIVIEKEIHEFKQTVIEHKTEQELTKAIHDQCLYKIELLDKLQIENVNRSV